MNILRALEKLSADSEDKKKAASENAAADDAPEKAVPAQKNADAAQTYGGYTENLLARHERSVNRIKNGGR